MNTISLESVADFIKDIAPYSYTTPDNYISTENMLPDRKGITVSGSCPKTGNVRAFKTGDILISNIRPYFKKIWLADFDGYCSQDVLIIRPKIKRETQYLYAVLSQNSFFDYSTKSSKGTKMPRGDIAAIKKYPIPVLKEDVMKFVGRLSATFNERIKVNDQINKNLFDLVESLYRKWFINRELPKNLSETDWKDYSISELVVIHDSKRIPLSKMEREKREKIYPYYGATSIMDYVDDYLFDGVYLLVGEDGSVINNSGNPILQYVDGKFWVNNHAHILTGAPGISVEFIYLILSNMNVQSIVTGAVQKKISQEKLKSLVVSLPDTSCISYFEELIQPFFDQLRINRNENRKLENLRDALLPKLLSGEIEIK